MQTDFILSNTKLHYEILVFHIKTVWFGYQLFPFILCEFNFFFLNKRSRGQAMGSWCQNADKPPSKLLAATQDSESCWPLSFQYQNFTHFNDYYDFKESNFHHCPSSATDLYRGVLRERGTKAPSLLRCVPVWGSELGRSRRRRAGRRRRGSAAALQGLLRLRLAPTKT